MSALVIETHGLGKEFRTRRGERRVAVRDLDLAVGEGGVHGFLGPNGSGKTTTIRMLLGLATPTAGTMQVLGRPVPGELRTVMRGVGAVVESPKFSPTRSGRKNLLLLARTLGAPVSAVDRSLETVRLAGRDRDRFKSYSLGMKQRLAIAATLLKEPRLLILDEPTNGLDPAGIREIRDTIRELGESGVTVLLSSHILAEVQQVCTSATIIGRGRQLASGSVADLLAGTGTSAYRVEVPDAAAASAALARHGLDAAPAEGEEHVLLVDTADPARVSRTLGEAGIWLTALAPVRRDLESVFLELTAEESLGTEQGGSAA